MFSDDLFNTLLEKNIVVKKSTHVYTEFEKVDFSNRVITLKDNFILDDVFKDTEGKLLLKVSRIPTQELAVVGADRVLLVDNMPAKSLAAAFDLNVNGTKKVLGKRRGRPKKVRESID